MSEEIRDRYVSFSNIDCDARAQQLLKMILRHAEAPDNGNPFWAYFLKRLHTGKHDDLFLLHCYLQGIRDSLEKVGDEEALELLAQVEEECM